tara:strand:+ start:18925 stop:19086 length:162 start_codon:yes stop_codon:yes gene_type:complete
MTEYGLFTKKDSEVITRKSFNSLEEAYSWFSQLKKMPLDKFKKIFIVTNITKT